MKYSRNPSADNWDGFIDEDNQDDILSVASARSAWNARKSESALVAWTLGPEWTNPKTLICGCERGIVHYGKNYAVGDEASGEIG